MSRVTAAFVCALCDPDNPRPASIMCSNNCGRYICAVHAMPRKGPGSAMICLACAEALGLVEKPKPVTVAASIVNVPSTSEVKPAPTPPLVPKPHPVVPEPRPSVTVKADEPFANVPAPKIEVRPVTPMVNQPAPTQSAQRNPDAALAGSVAIPPSKVEPTSASPKSTFVVPSEEQSQTARRLVDPPPPPQSSETIVSQRGNTLQVPKVTAPNNRPSQSTGATPRVAKRADGAWAGMDRQMIVMWLGTAALAIVGLVMILAAVFTP